MAHRCIVIGIIVVIVLASRDISAIKCWRCTSSNSKFCGDVLDHSNLTVSQLSWYYVHCGSVRKKLDYKGDKMIAKCNLRIDLAYNQLVYTRKCVEEAENANLNSCVTDEVFNDNDDPNIQLMSCETCMENGCNDKIKNYFVTDDIESSISSSGLINTLVEPMVALCSLIILVCSH